ncbi:MAG: CoA transferase [Dehalococcoidia bacterium]|nr:CoA transferase [Dehalococcoidia bacterium]
MSGPLIGYRGVVLTQAWAGAFCTELLGIMGAEVIQVEVRKRPDSWRGGYDAPIAARVAGRTEGQHSWNNSGLFNAVNLNKQSITLDLQTPEGMATFKRLLPEADFMAENFSPRVLGNLGIGYEDLRQIKPDIILASLSAYGATGPYFNVPGIGGTIEPTSGMSGLLGYEGGQPLNSGSMFPDPVAGWYGFSAILAALHHRERTGEGQYIDLSMMEANLTVVGEAALEYALTGQIRGPLGNRHRTFAPHGIYPALGQSEGGIGGHEQWIALAAESEAQWRTLCGIAGHPEWLTDARFADNAARKANEDALDGAITAWTATQPRDDLARALATAGVPAAPVFDALEVADDTVFRERGLITEVTHDEAGAWPQIGVPFRLARTPAAVTRPAPLQGQHTAEVLARFLGTTAEEYEELVRKGVTGSGPPD